MQPVCVFFLLPVVFAPYKTVLAFFILFFTKLCDGRDRTTSLHGSVQYSYIYYLRATEQKKCVYLFVRVQGTGRQRALGGLEEFWFQRHGPSVDGVSVSGSEGPYISG
jgi:hypothetical protein